MSELFFLVKVSLPEWGATEQQAEWIRAEIEQHAGAAVAFYTRARHVDSCCELARDKTGVLDRLNKLKP